MPRRTIGRLKPPTPMAADSLVPVLVRRAGVGETQRQTIGAIGAVVVSATGIEGMVSGAAQSAALADASAAVAEAAKSQAEFAAANGFAVRNTLAEVEALLEDEAYDAVMVFEVADDGANTGRWKRDGDVLVHTSRRTLDAIGARIEYDGDDTRPGFHVRQPNGRSVFFANDRVIISRPFQREQRRVDRIDRKVAEDATDPRPGMRVKYANGKSPFEIGSRLFRHPDTDAMRAALRAQGETIARLRGMLRSTPPQVPLATVLADDEYGQSNANGVGSTYISTEAINRQIAFAKMWLAERMRDYGTFPDTDFLEALLPLQGAHVQQGSVHYGEGSFTCAVVLERLMADLHGIDIAADLGQVILYQRAGEGSKTAAQLGPGTTYLDRLLAGHARGYTLYGKLFMPVHMHLQLGEDDQQYGTDPADYITDVDAILDTIEADRESKAGITSPYRLSVVQLATHLTNGEGTRPTIAEAQLQHARTSPRVSLSTPAYVLSMADAQHRDTDGHAMAQGYRALAFHRWIYLGTKPVFLDPQEPIRDGRHLVVPIAGVDGAIAWDTTQMPPHPNGTYGFEVAESTAPDAEILAIEVPEIIAGRYVRLSRASGSMPAGAEWRAGFTGSASMGWTNLRDRQGDRHTCVSDGRTRRLDKWMPISAGVAP